MFSSHSSVTASQSTKSQQTEKRLVILRDTDTLVRVIDWEINPALSIEWTRNFLLGSIGLKVSIPYIILYRLNSQFK